MEQHRRPPLQTNPRKVPHLDRRRPRPHRHPRRNFWLPPNGTKFLCKPGRLPLWSLRFLRPLVLHEHGQEEDRLADGVGGVIVSVCLGVVCVTDKSRIRYF
jgi:hypothetical protein